MITITAKSDDVYTFKITYDSVDANGSPVVLAYSESSTEEILNDAKTALESQLAIIDEKLAAIESYNG